MFMQRYSNQRIVYLDLLRVIATFIVIFRHVCSIEFYHSPLSLDWCIASIYNFLVPKAAPIFVMISGALLLNPYKEVTYRDILKKRIPRLLLVYVFWALLYVLYGFALRGFNEFTLWRLFRRAMVIPCVHLWFLPMLMGVYLLTPMLRKIAKDNKLLHYVLIIWIVYVFVSFFQFVEAFQLVRHFYSLFNMNIIVGFSGYFLLGYFLSRQDFSKRQRIWFYLLGIAGASVIIFATFHIAVSTGEANERYFTNLSIQVVAMATALFVLVKELAPKCGTQTLKFVDFVRKDLFGIYLTHMLWVPIVNTTTLRHCCSEVITIPLIAIIIFLLSLFTTKLIRLVPGLRKVVE